MNIYAVFLPSGVSVVNSLERAVLVKQGFNWEAFWITPFWAVRRRLFLALGLWIAWNTAIAAMALGLQGDGEVAVLLYLIGATAFGLEADRLEQSRLTRSGYLLQGLALGVSSREAEAIYFNGRSGDVFPPRAQAPRENLGVQTSPKTPTVRDMDILGLFPSGESKV